MLAILTTHPIQYQVPLWQALAKDGRVPFEVWYLTSHALQPSHDREFGSNFAWDLDMLEGYSHRFLKTPEGATPNTFCRCRVTESLPDLFKETNAEAIWIQGWQVAAYWQAAWAAKHAGIGVWLRGESNDLAPVPAWKRPIKRLMLGQLFKRVDRFLYIGSANRRLYEHYGVPNEKLYPALYAVDNERFRLQAREIRNSKVEIRKQWCIPQDAFVVLFCGKFIVKKRPMDLIKAAQLLLRSHPELKTHLLFVGSGELGAELRASCNVVSDADAPQKTEDREQRTENRRAPDNREPRKFSGPSDGRPITDNAKPAASFTGFLNQTQVSSAYVAADVLVLPSDYGETWGLVVNEAMASGLPCIVSDRCGCAEDLATVEPNQIFQCRNIGELAKRLASHKVLRLGAESFSKQLTGYSFDQTVGTIERCFNNG